MFRQCQGDASLLLLLCIPPFIQSVVGVFGSYEALQTTPEFQQWAFLNFERTGWPNKHGPLLEQYILGGYVVSSITRFSTKLLISV